MSTNKSAPGEWRPVTIYAAIIFAMIFWSLSYVWTNIAIRSFSVFTLLESRLLVASVLMLIFGKITGKLAMPRREDFKWFLLLALFEPFLYFIGETYGLTRISPTVASVMIATIPLFAPFTAWFVLREKITATNIAGAIVSFGGIVFIVTSGNGQSGATDPVGVALICFAIVSAIFYSIILKKLSAHYNGISLITYQNIIGFFYFLPFFLFVDAPHLHAVVWRTDAIVSMLLLALFASFIAFVLFAESVRRIGVARSNVFCNLLPVLTAVFSALILHEILADKQIIGMLVVVAGLFVSQITKRAIK